MARPKKKQPAWGICVHHPDGTCGWVIGNDLEVLTYPSQEDAEKAFKQMKRKTHYSWSLPIEIKEFTGLPNEDE